MNVNASLDTHATALAHITKVVTDLDEAHATIGQLRADLHHEQDRCELLAEERNRYRGEAMIFRNKLIELATKMADIGLLTVSAQEIMHTVSELNNAAVPSSEALAKLEEEFNKGNEAGEAA
jgi:hypothetical protein